MTARAGADIVAFDFDGTLTYKDTLRKFLVECCGRSRLYRCALRHLPILARSAGGGPARDIAKARLVGHLLAGLAEADARAAADRVAEHTIAGNLRPDTTASVRAHLDAGHRVVIVSASFELYVAPIARHLGIDEVIATRLEVVDHRLTGRLDGANVRSATKAILLRERTGAKRVGWAYGDSAGDTEMLAMSDTPVWVRRGPVALPTVNMGR